MDTMAKDKPKRLAASSTTMDTTVKSNQSIQNLQEHKRVKPDEHTHNDGYTGENHTQSDQEHMRHQLTQKINHSYDAEQMVEDSMAGIFVSVSLWWSACGVAARGPSFVRACYLILAL